MNDLHWTTTIDSHSLSESPSKNDVSRSVSATFVGRDSHAISYWISVTITAAPQAKVASVSLVETGHSSV
jgi:hypothetical protein